MLQLLSKIALLIWTRVLGYLLAQDLKIPLDPRRASEIRRHKRRWAIIHNKVIEALILNDLVNYKK
jgi:hypothetical protein